MQIITKPALIIVRYVGKNTFELYNVNSIKYIVYRVTPI